MFCAEVKKNGALTGRRFVQENVVVRLTVNGAGHQVTNHFAESGRIIQLAAFGDDRQIEQQVSIVLQGRSLLVLLVKSLNLSK